MKNLLYLILVIFILISCSPVKKGTAIKKIPEPEIVTIDYDLYASSFIPKSYKEFTYFKNGDIAYKKFIKNDFYKTLKDNYLFLDIKYNFSGDRDMFFTKFNFDFDSIFRYIERDIAFGNTDNGFFLISSMTFKSKVLTKLLNVAPDSVIKEITHKGNKIYTINKGSSSIYYSVVEGYILFADSKETIVSSLDAAINKINLDREYQESLTDSDLLYVKKIDSNKNPFDIFPLISELEVVYNTDIQSVRYSATPLKDPEPRKEIEDSNVYETLKLLNREMPMVLYNKNYDLEAIVNSMANGENRAQMVESSKIITEHLMGTYFVSGNISSLITGGSPELGLILNVNSGNELEEVAIKLTSLLLGINWTLSETSSTGKLYQTEISDFYLITTDNNIALFTKKSIAVDFFNRTTSKGASLYDRHMDSFNSDKLNLDSFICFNPEGINNSLEPLIKRYLYSNIDMDDYEYDRSFGGLLTYFSGIKPGYMDLNYNNESGNLNGSIRQVP